MRTVDFHADRLRLSGSLFLPEERPAAGVPAVVFCHGFGATREYVAADIARALRDRGIGVLTFDHRGFGESEGERWRMLPHEQVADIRSAVVYLSTCEGVDPTRLGLYGISFGGAHAICAAAAEPLVRATVSCVPFADGAEWMRSMRRYWEWCELLDEIARDRVDAVVEGRSAEVDPDRILVRDPESVEWNEWLKRDFPSRSEYRLPLETAGAIIEYAPIRHADRVSNLMIIAAGRDTLVPREHAGALYAAASEPKELLTLPDATHHDIYRGHHFDEVVDAAARWLSAHLDTTNAEVRNR
ncbi:alpha/beta fold hydrolase [Plantactinospora sp. B6F1]|uniref:alpha/beta hydrolase n=1 Tax=Plantactinospora sp. B6F1 TaxID=3158971 RepID=UPI0032D98C36